MKNERSCLRGNSRGVHTMRRVSILTVLGIRNAGPQKRIQLHAVCPPRTEACRNTEILL